MHDQWKLLIRETLYEMWNLNDCAADGQSSGENWTVLSQGTDSWLGKALHPYLEAAFKWTSCHLFLWVSDPLSALDWLILTLVSSTWTWSECKSQVCVFVCLHLRACISGICVFVCSGRVHAFVIEVLAVAPLIFIKETWGDWQYPLL